MTNAGRWFDSLTQSDGSAAASSGVTVYLPGTNTLATLYSNHAKSSTVGNPTTTDSLGNLEIYALPGEYELLRTGTATRIKISVPVDPADVGVGTTGPAGPTGPAGNTVLYGTGAPAAGLGVDGNFYIDKAAWQIYGPKATGAWPAGVSLIGPTGATGAVGSAGATGATGATGPQGAAGPTGPTGAAGTNGNTILYGTTAPASGVGANNDFYIDKTNWVIYGPKAAGAWPAGVSLIGPAGPPGSGGSGGGAGALAYIIAGSDTNTTVKSGANVVMVAGQDFAPILSAAVTAVGAGGKIVVRGTVDMLTDYNCTTSIMLDMSLATLNMGPSVNYGLRFSGAKVQIGSTGAFTTVAAGSRTITTAANYSASLPVGSRILLQSNAQFAARDYYEVGEPNRVKSVSGTTVTLEWPLVFDYNTVDSLTLYRYDDLQNLDIECPKTVANTSSTVRAMAMQVQWADRPIIRNFWVTQGDKLDNGIELVETHCAVLDRPHTERVLDLNRFAVSGDTSFTGYGWHTIGAYRTIILEPTDEHSRHGGDASSLSGRPPSMFTQVFGGEAFHTEAAGISTHGGAYMTEFADFLARDCGGGVINRGWGLSGRVIVEGVHDGTVSPYITGGWPNQSNKHGLTLGETSQTGGETWPNPGATDVNMVVNINVTGSTGTNAYGIYTFNPVPWKNVNLRIERIIGIPNAAAFIQGASAENVTFTGPGHIDVAAGNTNILFQLPFNGTSTTRVRNIKIKDLTFNGYGARLVRIRGAGADVSTDNADSIVISGLRAVGLITGSLTAGSPLVEVNGGVWASRAGALVVKDCDFPEQTASNPLTTSGSPTVTGGGTPTTSGSTGTFQHGGNRNASVYDSGAPMLDAVSGVWRTAAGVPANSLGADGDWYVNSTTGDVYQRAAGVYTLIGNIRGGTVEKFGDILLAAGTMVTGTDILPGGQLVDATTTVVKVYLHADVAPTGGSITVNAVDSAGNLYFSQVIAAGANDQASSTVTAIAIPAGTRLRFNAVCANTGGGQKVVVTFVCDSSVAGAAATVNGMTTEDWTALSGTYTTSGPTGLIPTVSSGKWQVVFAAADNGGGQDQFVQTSPRTLIPKSYPLGHDFVVQALWLTPPKLDIEAVGFLFDNGDYSGSSSARWVDAYCNHYTPGGNPFMYHQGIWWNGSSQGASGKSQESSDTFWDSNGGFWMQIKRVGTVWSYSTSPDGVTWTQRWSNDLTTGDFAISRFGPTVTHSSSTGVAWTPQLELTRWSA